MPRRISPLAFVVTFFALTLLPGLQMLTRFAPDMAVDENRRLAPAPSVATPLDKLPRVADRWYTDHFGLRSVLIKMKTQIDYSVFALSDRVLIGKDGQLFYRATVNLHEPAVDATLLRSGGEIVQGFADFAKALSGAGIGCMVTVVSMSDRFYPDLLPRDAIRRPAHPQIDTLLARLSAIPDIRFIDSTTILKSAMRERRIFHKTDFHWNDPGAFPVAQAIVDKIGAAEGRSLPVWQHPLAIERRWLSGGIAMFMPLFFPPGEDGLFVKQTWEWPPGFKESIDQGAFEDVTEAAADPKLLPPTVFVGDSFLDGMLRAGLQAYFVETRRLRWSPKLKASTLAASLPANTRWLVIEFIETNRFSMIDFADKSDVSKAVEILARRHQSPDKTR